jgi:hypothetical protein
MLRRSVNVHDRPHASQLHEFLITTRPVASALLTILKSNTVILNYTKVAC